MAGLPLQVQPGSGLDFPWAFLPHLGFSAGHDGVLWSEDMMIYWADLQEAVTAILGYSYREVNEVTGVGVLRRKLPWQHPFWNQLWLKNITAARAIRFEGTSTSNPGDDDFIVAGGGVGAGVPMNFGPWTEFDRVVLTIQFWRPPYYVRSDDDVVGEDGRPQEWLRYTDKVWSSRVQMLTRGNQYYNFTPGQTNAGGTAITNQFRGSVGIPCGHFKVTRTWYEVPEACLLTVLSDGTPQGIMQNQMYTLTTTTNPITNLVYVGNNDVPETNNPITFCVNSPIGGGFDDSDHNNRFFGCLMGTLRFDSCELIPRQLQLPPYLMQIPLLAGNEAISQVQYDVRMHFDLFDPPRGEGCLEGARGHNLCPYPGDGLWYAVQSQEAANLAGSFSTSLNYADFSDIFTSL